MVQITCKHFYWNCLHQILLTTLRMAKQLYYLRCHVQTDLLAEDSYCTKMLKKKYVIDIYH